MKTKSAAPQITDSALRMPTEVPEIPQEVIDRFPEMAGWMDGFKRFWNQNTNAIQDFARATLDVTEIAGVFVVDGANKSIYVKGTRDRGAYDDTDTPFYTDAQGYFSLGSALTWNPKTLELTVDGTIIADAGNIGGFEIGEDFIRDEGDSFGLSSASTGAPPFVRFWAGDTFANRDIAPFRVYDDGSMFASMGTIGGWTIGATTLSGGNAVLSSTGTLLLGTGSDVVILDANDATYRLWIGNASAGSASFSVTKAGLLFANNATIAGTFVASDDPAFPTWQGGTLATRGVFNQRSGGVAPAYASLAFGTSGLIESNIAAGSYAAKTAVVTTGIGLLLNTKYYNGASWVSGSSIEIRNDASVSGTAAASSYVQILTTNTSTLTSIWRWTSAGRLEIGDAFGQDTNLYRSAANTLRTDDTLSVGGDFNLSGTLNGVGATFSGTVNANAFNTTSSIRFKENIRPLVGAMELVRRLHGVVFDWKTRHQDDDIGFIAEDVAQVLPMMVGRDVDGIPSGVDYGRVTAVLVQALKELEEKINGLGLHGRRS